MGRKLVLSTDNENKLREIKDILKDLNIEVLSKSDVGLSHIDIVEDGKTLQENSLKKASTLAEKIDYMVMADDSGLFVDALNGQPGVYSSRYGGEEGNDEKNNEKLLKEMENIEPENRKASFITVISLISEGKEIHTIRGECKGIIENRSKGQMGFGYDPLFTPEGYNKTFGQLGDDIKNKISHRAVALKEMKNLLISLIEDDINENNSSK